MAKLIIDVQDLGNPVEGDVIVFKDNKWQIATHETCFITENQELKRIENDNKLMREELQKMNEKLKTMAIAIKGARK